MPSKKLHIVPLQILAGAILAFAIYFGSESFFNFITDILRPVFHYGYPDSLFAAIVLYVPVLSVLVPVNGMWGVESKWIPKSVFQ